MPKVTVDQTHLDFIPRIYEAAIHPEKWPAVLEEFSAFCGAAGASLMLGDTVHPEIVSRPVSPLFKPQYVAEYERRFGEEETRALSSVARHPVQTWITEEQALGKPATEIGANLYMRSELGLDRRVATRLNDTQIWFDGLSLNFNMTRGNITEEEIAISKLFLPHLAKTVELSRPFLWLESRFHSVLNVLNKLRLGVIICRRNGNVVVTNEQADIILSANNGLALSHDKHLLVGDTKSQTLLDEAIAIQAQQLDQQHSAKLALPKKDRTRAYLCELFPLTDFAGTFDARFEGTVIFISDPDGEDDISTDGLAKLYELTTAEQEVCHALVNGMTAKDIAASRDTSEDTVRWHLKGVRAKTNSKSQMDLVRLALKVDIPLDRD